MLVQMPTWPIALGALPSERSTLLGDDKILATGSDVFNGSFHPLQVLSLPAHAASRLTMSLQAEQYALCSTLPSGLLPAEHAAGKLAGWPDTSRPVPLHPICTCRW